MLTIRFNTKRALDDLSLVERLQFPFATSLALNWTALDRQRVMRERIAERLIIRDAPAQRLFRQAVRFAEEDWADKRSNKQTATVRILGRDTPAERRQYKRIGQLIIRQDVGGTKTSSAPVRVIARDRSTGARERMEPAGFIIPAPGLRTNTKGVPRKLYPKNLGFQMRKVASQFRRGDRSVDKFGFARLKKRTKRNQTTYFTIPGVGIFQREHLGSGSEVSAVWFFKREITVQPLLDLDGAFHKSLPEVLHRNFERAMAHAVQTARRW